MFGKQINKSNSSFITQIVAQSKYQKFDNTFKKKINLPATLFNKSPLKDRQNKQIIGNMPIKKASTNNLLKILQPSDQSKRISISPLRNRRQGSNLSEISKKEKVNESNKNINLNLSINNSQINKPKKMEHINDTRKAVCENHKNKKSKFIICIEDEQIPYCEKCAISLVSQGFVVKKIDEEEQQNPRTQQIKLFLQDLESIMKVLQEKKQEVQRQIQNSNESYNQQKSYINIYYQYVIESILNKKQSFLKSYNEEQQTSQASALQSLKIITQAINDSLQIKQDIQLSLELINKTEQVKFRPTMQYYKNTSKNLKQYICKIEISRIKEAKKLNFNNVEYLTSQILKKLEVKIEQNNQSQNKFPTSISVQNDTLITQKSNVNISFDHNSYEDFEENHFETQNNEIVGNYNQKQENPLEHISEQEYGKQKSIKSSSKDVKSCYFAEFNQ